MASDLSIKKASGEEEIFHKDKFCASLKKAGAPEEIIEGICERISKEIELGMSTSDIFQKASEYLMQQHPGSAARYNLKRGIAMLGPAGFIFEQFVEVVLQTLGYETKRDQIMQGKCVTHEIDVVAKKDGVHYLVEAKYHNKNGIKTPLNDVMYSYARLLDVQKKREEVEPERHEHRVWLFTNTKFTTKAIAYGKCKNIPLTGWNYPDEGLEDIIAKHALYPVTVLPSVNTAELEIFAKHNLMLARDLAPYTADDLTKKFGINKNTAEEIIEEAHLLVFGIPHKEKRKLVV